MPRLIVFFFLPWLMSPVMAQSPATTAEALLLRGEYRRAGAYIDSALIHARGTERIALQLASYRRYRNLRSGRKMVTSLREIPADSLAQAPSVLQLEYLISRAEAAEIRGEWEDCLRIYDRAQKDITTVSPTTLQARLHYVHGKILRSYRHDLPAGATAFHEAIKLLAADPRGDVFLQGEMLRTLGHRARTDGDFPRSRDYYERELRLYQTHFRPSHYEIGNVHYFLGAVFYEMAEHQAALDHFLACHAIWEQEFHRSDRYKKYLYQAIGDMYWELDNRPGALKFYNMASAGESTVQPDSSDYLTAQADSL
ncbi:MAG: tetratricopeptide repeat protein, partial [Bacteroidota bacterium]